MKQLGVMKIFLCKFSQCIKDINEINKLGKILGCHRSKEIGPEVEKEGWE